MSRQTGVVIKNTDRFFAEHGFVANLGHPTPDMSDYELYAPDAVIPLEPRPFTEGDREWLERERRATELTPPLGRIAIVRPIDLDDGKIHELQQFAADNPPGFDLTPGKTRSKMTVTPKSLWKPYGTISDPVNKNAETVPHYIVPVNESGMRTTTQAPALTPPHIALHFDRWFRAITTEEFLEAPNRFGLNLGPGSRNLLIGSDVFDIMDEFPAPVGDVPLFGLAHLRQYVTWRLQQGRPLRAVGLRVPPSWGYVKPSELVAHDVSTVAIPHLSGEDEATRNQPSQSAMWIGKYCVGTPEFDKHFEFMF